jgi:hypothetical protein
VPMLLLALVLQQQAGSDVVRHLQLAGNCDGVSRDCHRGFALA